MIRGLQFGTATQVVADCMCAAAHRCECAGAPSGGVCIWRPWNTRYTWTCEFHLFLPILLLTAKCDAESEKKNVAVIFLCRSVLLISDEYFIGILCESFNIFENCSSKVWKEHWGRVFAYITDRISCIINQSAQNFKTEKEISVN